LVEYYMSYTSLGHSCSYHMNLCQGTYMHVQLVTYLLTPYSSVLLEKLTVLS